MTAGSILRGIAILLALQWVSVLFLQALHIAFPPALLGMILLAVLLLTGVIREESVEDACTILIEKMGMLFLPAGISMLLYRNFYHNHRQQSDYSYYYYSFCRAVFQTQQRRKTLMFFPEALLNSPMFGIGLTIIVYVFCELIVNRFELNIIPPFVLACPIIMGIIYFQSPHITYEQYAAGANFINFLLGPATVALALPLYRNRQTLKNNLAVIVSGVVVATVIGIVSIFVCGKLFGASEQVLLSLIPKSVTTPIAMDISSVIGGIPSLTAACVIFTGMFGSTFNHKILSWLGFKNDIAIGLAIGASSHGLGTSACVNKSALQLAIGGVAIGLTGIATSILAPLLLPLLTNLF
jgi:predicted murein hydrolase (TIGR00659 family)